MKFFISQEIDVIVECHELYLIGCDKNQWQLWWNGWVAAVSFFNIHIILKRSFFFVFLIFLYHIEDINGGELWLRALIPIGRFARIDELPSSWEYKIQVQWYWNENMPFAPDDNKHFNHVFGAICFGESKEPKIERKRMRILMYSHPFNSIGRWINVFIRYFLIRMMCASRWTSSLQVVIIRVIK